MNNTELRRQVLWELFDLSNQFMQDLGIEYWVNYGTLLGFYRENNIIGHDIDIDFGCAEEHYPYILSMLDKLDPKLTMYDTSFRNLGPKLYMSYKGFDADIYFYKIKDEQLYTFEKTSWGNYNAPIPANLAFPTKELTVNGISTREPNDTKEYLKTIYGSLEKGAVRNSKTGYWE